MSWCKVHERFESATRAYRVCAECAHVFESQDEMVREHNEMWGDDRPAHDVSDVLACPFCDADI